MQRTHMQLTQRGYFYKQQLRSYLFNLFIALGRLIANITHLFTLQRACLLALLSPRVRMSKQAHADPDACAAVIAEPAQLHRM
jgi:hypothetical protein